MGPSQICPYKCRFCEHQVLKDYTEINCGSATRNEKDVLDEIAAAWKKGARSAVFLEGNFCTYPDWIKKFTLQIKKHFPGFFFAIGTRLTDVIRSELDGNLKRLRDAGLVSICCGIESADNRILSHAKKQETVEEYLEANEILCRWGIKRFYSIILGLPGETQDSINLTLDFMRELKPDHLQVCLAIPFPGTPMYNEAKRKGWIKSDDFERYYYYGQKAAVLEHKLKAEKLVELQKSIYNEFNNK
jgi:radical SAM superfamily enzyme YgiQ (UPF0313 family)